MIVFDLDGTISDSLPGILCCLNDTLASFSYATLTEREVSRFIGPPIDTIFRQLTGSDDRQLIADMVGTYREQYGRTGYAENTLYPGIADAIRFLASRGIVMGICTSKRADFAGRSLEMSGLRECFLFVSSGDIGITKADQLRSLLDTGTIGQDAIMVGDRAVDILAARSAGIGSAGVLWGYGSEGELREVSPDRIFERPEQLRDLAGDILTCRRGRRNGPGVVRMTHYSGVFVE